MGIDFDFPFECSGLCIHGVQRASKIAEEQSSFAKGGAASRRLPAVIFPNLGSGLRVDRILFFVGVVMRSSKISSVHRPIGRTGSVSAGDCLCGTFGRLSGGECTCDGTQRE